MQLEGADYLELIARATAQIPPANWTVAPERREIVVRDRTFQLTAMSGVQLLDWIEIQLLSAKGIAHAMAVVSAAIDGFAPEATLRGGLEEYYTARNFQCIRLLGDADLVADLSEREKQDVIAAQDELNRIHVFANLREKLKKLQEA